MRHIVHRTWDAADGLAEGAHDGTAVADGTLVVREPCGTRDYADPHRAAPARRYEQAVWTSQEVPTGGPVTEVVPSWNASTPPGTWVEVSVAATLDDGTVTPFYVLGRWAETDADIHPTSVPGQDDQLVEVSFDTLAVRGPRTATSYRLRVALLREVGTDATPSVSLLSAVASGPAPALPTSAPGDAAGTVLDVPGYSQQLHRDVYPHWGSGGQAWCSPTAVSMVLHFWGRGPAEGEYAWVDPALPDRFIVHAARHTFDYHYGGAGNWAFNTAYAARYGLTAYVTRLRDLTEAERFIDAGIPLVVGMAFGRDDLTGAGYDTDGHLLTVIGFDDAGNVVSNDPASHEIPSNDEVRTTFDRGEFERIWQASGGLAYVIHPPQVRTPAPPAQPNWR